MPEIVGDARDPRSRQNDLGEVGSRSGIRWVSEPEKAQISL